MQILYCRKSAKVQDKQKYNNCAWHSVVLVELNGKSASQNQHLVHFIHQKTLIEVNVFMGKGHACWQTDVHVMLPYTAGDRLQMLRWKSKNKEFIHCHLIIWPFNTWESLHWTVEAKRRRPKNKQLVARAAEGWGLSIPHLVLQWVLQGFFISVYILIVS